jgi:predicted 2-oxoglutarate/Fe(II)-dependent dioxygenase YbiX
VSDSILLRGFFEPALTERMMREMAVAPGAAAVVYGDANGSKVDTRVRSAQILEVSQALRDAVRERLAAAQEHLSRHFEVKLSLFEEPKFLRYGAGDFFVAHQDGNTSLLRDDTRHRRVSAVVFLNEGSYGGGSLVFHGAYPNIHDRDAVTASSGDLIAFRSELTHEVTPVAHGERFTIVTWYRE